MLRLIFVSICSLFAIAAMGQQSGPDVHLIKKNLHVDGNISSAGGKDLIMQTNVVTRMTILDSNGFTGIGLTNPQELLHLNGSIRGNQTAGALRVNTEQGWLDLGAQDGTSAHIFTGMSRFLLNKSLWVDGDFSSFGTRDLNLQTNGTTRMTILDGNGFVGIGNTNPTQLLEVSGNTIVRDTLFADVIEVEEFAATNGLFNGNVRINQNLVVDGLTGLGVENPTERLDIEGNIQVTETVTATTLVADQVNAVEQSITGNLEVNQNATVDGFVGIGTTEVPQEFKLGVDGKILAEELTIRQSENWEFPDYVFEKSYALLSISELKEFIEKEGHLPKMPSAEQVKNNNGFDLGAMNLLLLEKVEELTLHIIQISEDYREVKEELSKLKK